MLSDQIRDPFFGIVGNDVFNLRTDCNGRRGMSKMLWSIAEIKLTVSSKSVKGCP